MLLVIIDEKIIINKYFLSLLDVLATKFDAREMFKKLPFLERLRNNEKDGIERFFVDKVCITIFFCIVQVNLLIRAKLFFYGGKSRFSNNPLIDIIHYTVHVFIATFDLSQFERTGNGSL